MVRARTRFHTDQTARNVGKPPLKLGSQGLQLQHNIPALIEPNQVECVLANIDTDRDDRR
jgi:hypothetical protein